MKKYVFFMTAAAAAAKSLQSCPTLCNLIDGSAPGSSTHGIFQAGVLEWGAIPFSGMYWWPYVILKHQKAAQVFR